MQLTSRSSTQNPVYRWAVGPRPEGPQPCLLVQVVVVPQPASTNAAVIADSAPRLSAENITILSRLAQNRLTQQVGQQACHNLR